MMSLVQCVVQRIEIRTCYSLFNIQLTLFAAVLVLLIYRSEGVIKVHTRNTDGVHESCVITAAAQVVHPVESLDS